MKLRRRQTLLNATHLVGSPTDARLVWPVLKPKALLTRPETQDRCQRGSLGSGDARKAGSGFPAAVLQPDEAGDRAVQRPILSTPFRMVGKMPPTCHR